MSQSSLPKGREANIFSRFIVELWYYGLPLWHRYVLVICMLTHEEDLSALLFMKASEDWFFVNGG